MARWIAIVAAALALGAIASPSAFASGGVSAPIIPAPVVLPAVVVPVPPAPPLPTVVVDAPAVRLRCPDSVEGLGKCDFTGDTTGSIDRLADRRAVAGAAPRTCATDRRAGREHGRSRRSHGCGACTRRTRISRPGARHGADGACGS